VAKTVQNLGGVLTREESDTYAAHAEHHLATSGFAKGQSRARGDCTAAAGATAMQPRLQLKMAFAVSA
jgi:hypothetical protein